MPIAIFHANGMRKVYINIAREAKLSQKAEGKMSGIDELDVYIELMDRQLQHPFTTRISLANGRFDSSIVRFGDSTLSKDRRYKDALFEEQLKRRRRSIEEEIKEKLSRLILPLEQKKKGKEGKLNSIYKKKEQAEKEKVFEKKKI